MTPCTGQTGHDKCLACARLRAIAIMRPVVQLVNCKMFVPKRGAPDPARGAA